MVLKINVSIKTKWHYYMKVAQFSLWAPQCACTLRVNDFRFADLMQNQLGITAITVRWAFFLISLWTKYSIVNVNAFILTAMFSAILANWTAKFSEHLNRQLYTNVSNKVTMMTKDKPEGRRVPEVIQVDPIEPGKQGKIIGHLIAPLGWQRSLAWENSRHFVTTPLHWFPQEMK